MSARKRPLLDRFASMALVGDGCCRNCPSHPEPPLDPPLEEDEDALTEEDIRMIKADERDDDRRGK